MVDAEKKKKEKKTFGFRIILTITAALQPRSNDPIHEIVVSPSP
jgi:hypothetical protein